ncbi:MAG: flagellar hook protein FlgE [Bryobacteraceae bacterium]
MSSAFSIALSSLKAQSDAINTTGNNLANLNTVGFKTSNVDFRDLVASTLGWSSSAGMGVSRPTTQRSFSQGTITTSDSPWAAAIQGNGFFMLKSAAGQSLYTRNGNFTVSSDGVLSTLSGEKVQGWMASPSGLNTGVAPTDIAIPAGQTLAAQATSKHSFTANLNAAGTAAGSTDHLNVSVPVVDSLGNSHTLTVALTKGATANTWNYDVTIPGEDLAGGTAGTQTSILSAPGTLTFNTDGTLSTSSGAPVTLSISGLADGASNMSMNWSLLNSDGTSSITQYAQTSAFSGVTQDGMTAATLNKVAVSDNGQITASFSNGQQKILGQLALATFQNLDSVEAVGNNNYAATGASSTASVGTAMSADRGEIVGGALENSNVDIATQFTNLITYQRGYQASSRVITTEDNMLQDLLQVIR